MIVFDHVTKKYKTNIGLDDVSVRIDKGDFVFLVGPSGAGKSTFVKLILREIDADKGRIIVKGEDVTEFSNRRIPKLRRNIGIVFQDFRLLPKKTVYENVAFAMEIVHKSAKTIKRQVPQVLGLVGMSGDAQKYPDELSAGEQQRVAIARAIINNPELLIADEPTGNLDPDTAWEIMQLLAEINARGTTVLMVTHAKDIVDRMDKRVIAIDNGKIVRDDFGTYNLDENTWKQEDVHDTIQMPFPTPHSRAERERRMAELKQNPGRSSSAAERLRKRRERRAKEAKLKAEREARLRAEKQAMKKASRKARPLKEEEDAADKAEELLNSREAGKKS